MTNEGSTTWWSIELTNEGSSYWWATRSQVYHGIVDGLTNEACNADRARQRGGFQEGPSPPRGRWPCLRCAHKFKSRMLPESGQESTEA